MKDAIKVKVSAGKYIGEIGFYRTSYVRHGRATVFLEGRGMKGDVIALDNLTVIS